MDCGVGWGGESADGEGEGRGVGDEPAEVYLMGRMTTILR